MRRFLSCCGVVAMLLATAGFARADGAADAKALIEKATKALGGDNLGKLKAGTSTMKGKFYGLGDGIDYIGSVAFQSPDKQRLEIEFEMGGQKFKFTQIINKDKGWAGITDMVNELDKDAVAELKENLHADAVSRLNPAALKDAKLETLGEVKINEKAAVGVRVEVKGHRDVCLFFDKETNLLLKRERRAKDVQGGEEFTEETYYSDYKKVEGVQMPHKANIQRDGKKFVESEIVEIKLVEKVDDAQFAKP